MARALPFTTPEAAELPKSLARFYRTRPITPLAVRALLSNQKFDGNSRPHPERVDRWMKVLAAKRTKQR